MSVSQHAGARVGPQPPHLEGPTRKRKRVYGLRQLYKGPKNNKQKQHATALYGGPPAGLHRCDRGGHELQAMQSSSATMFGSSATKLAKQRKRDTHNENIWSHTAQGENVGTAVAQDRVDPQRNQCPLANLVWTSRLGNQDGGRTQKQFIQQSLTLNIV